MKYTTLLLAYKDAFNDTRVDIDWEKVMKFFDDGDDLGAARYLKGQFAEAIECVLEDLGPSLETLADSKIVEQRETGLHPIFVPILKSFREVPK